MSDIPLSLVIIEAFAAFALLANLIAYRQQGVKAYRVYSGIAMLLLATHFFCIEAYAASVGCSLAVIRNIVSLKYNNWAVVIGFVALNFLGLGIEWFYFHHGAEILIAYSASIIFTVGTLRLENIIDIRRWFTLAELLNLSYAIIVGSLFGSIYSLLNLIILLVFWFRLYCKKQTASDSKP